MVSITLTPMLCSRFLKSSVAEHRRGIFDRTMQRFFDALHRGYEWSLRGVLRHRPVMLFVFVGVIGATVFLFYRVPKGFIPDTDMDFHLEKGDERADVIAYLKQLSSK